MVRMFEAMAGKCINKNFFFKIKYNTIKYYYNVGFLSRILVTEGFLSKKLSVTSNTMPKIY